MVCQNKKCNATQLYRKLIDGVLVCHECGHPIIEIKAPSPFPQLMMDKYGHSKKRKDF